jgi:heme-degrading monooxygenase HmoA
MRVIVSLGRFRSGLADEDVQKTFEERADRYRQVPGLIEKLYLRYPETGEFGAVFVWESEDALARFQESELATSIPGAYRVESASRIEVAEVCLVVKPGA